MCSLIRSLLRHPSTASFSTSSVSSEHHESPLPKAVGEVPFHLHRLPVCHRIEVLIQLRHQTFAEPAHDSGRLPSVLVIVEPLFGREPGHSHVIAGLSVSLRVPEVHHVDV